MDADKPRVNVYQRTMLKNIFDYAKHEFIQGNTVKTSFFARFCMKLLHKWQKCLQNGCRLAQSEYLQANHAKKDFRLCQV